MPRGTAARSRTRYAVRLTVPRRGGWRAWGAVRADFERGLTDASDPAIASAEIASELRRGADYVRVAVALTVVTTDVADALIIAWGAFRSAARDDPAGWEVAAAAAQVQPEPSLTESPITQRCVWLPVCGQAARARGTRSPSSFIWVARASMSPRSCPVMVIVSWASVPAISLQRQLVLADLDEVVQQLGLLAADAVIQADQQTVQPSGQIFVISRVHAHHWAGKGTGAAD